MQAALTTMSVWDTAVVSVGHNPEVEWRRCKQRILPPGAFLV